MTSHTKDDTQVQSKHKAYVFNLRDINEKLEQQNALLVLEADEKGNLTFAYLRDAQGYAAEVRSVDPTKPV